MKYCSFERFVPDRWYRKANGFLQNVRQSISTKIPRISISTFNSKNNNQKIVENKREERNVIEETTEPTLEAMDERKGKGKGKGKGKSSNCMEKSSTKVEK